MEKQNIIFVVGLLLACGLLFWVIATSMDQSVYSLDVNEAVAKRSELGDREIRVRGYVVPNSIRCEPDTDRCRFRATRGGEVIDIFYEGTRPDTFKDCADVVVTGRFTKDDVFQGVDLIAKCPSKYEELPGGCDRPEEGDGAGEGAGGGVPAIGAPAAVAP